MKVMWSRDEDGSVTAVIGDTGVGVVQYQGGVHLFNVGRVSREEAAVLSAILDRYAVAGTICPEDTK